jgi:hypothetical protein
MFDHVGIVFSDLFAEFSYCAFLMDFDGNNIAGGVYA